MVNGSLGNLLRSLVGDHVKSWDLKLCQAEFAHNHAVNRSTGFSPFQIVYGFVPRGSFDLLALPCKVRAHWMEFIVELQHIHQHAYDHFVASTSKYKEQFDKNRHLNFRV